MNIKKLLYRLILLALLTGLLSFSVGYIWLKNYSWRDISSTKEMKASGEKLNNTKELPSKFYNTYDIIKPFQRKSTMTNQVISRFTGYNKSTDCKCDNIGYILWNNDNINLDVNLSNLLKTLGYWKFGFGLENNSSPEKCFDYWINNNICIKGKFLKDLNALSLLKLNKEVKNLDTDEIIKLIAWHDVLKIGKNDLTMVNIKYEVLKATYESKKTSF